MVTTTIGTATGKMQLVRYHLISALLRCSIPSNRSFGLAFRIFRHSAPHSEVRNATRWQSQPPSPRSLSVPFSATPAPLLLNEGTWTAGANRLGRLVLFARRVQRRDHSSLIRRWQPSLPLDPCEIVSDRKPTHFTPPFPSLFLPNFLTLSLSVSL